MEKKTEYILQSEKEYYDCLKKLETPFNIKDSFERAYWFFYNLSYSFSGMQNANFGYARNVSEEKRDSKNILSRRVLNKVRLWSFFYERIKNVQIFNRDASKVIETLDNPSTLFYLDPPYPESDQSPYKDKYSMDDFNRLCGVLKEIKGKFLLSCYEKEGMNVDSSWNKEKKEVFSNALPHQTNMQSKSKRIETKRIETIFMNY